MNKKLHHLILLALLLISCTAKAQEQLNEIIIKDRIMNDGDTIDFIRICTDCEQEKPVLLICPGSLPKPLLLKKENQYYPLAIGSFPILDMIEKYHLVVISQPNTPLIVEDYASLNNQYAYITNPEDEHSYSPTYLKNNYQDKYVERANFLIDYLYQQPWANKDRLILFGHSQGSRVALATAKSNTKIFAVGLFSVGPDGRFAEMINKEILSAREGKETMEEAYNKIEEYYKYWREICQADEDAEDLAALQGDPIKTWKSFSHNGWQDLINLQMPVYIAYGTDDPASNGLELLPIYFELANKKNYEVKPYIGRGHNFERIENGHHNYDDMMWHDAMNIFLEWANTL